MCDGNAHCLCDRDFSTFGLKVGPSVTFLIQASEMINSLPNLSHRSCLALAYPSQGSIRAQNLMTFDGNPINYAMFINTFDCMVGNTSVSDSAKLNRLLEYCSGKASKVISLVFGRLIDSKS